MTVQEHRPDAWKPGTGEDVDTAALTRLNTWWRAANYLSLGQIYLMDNPLLRRPLAAEDINPRLLGHWGTTPGLNFIYAQPEPGDSASRPQRHLRDGPGTRRAGHGRQCLP